MNRLQLTLTNGKVFLSPFVYTDEQVQMRLRKFRWMLKKDDILEVVEVKKFPSIAPYSYNNVHTAYVKFIELMWEKLYAKEEANDYN